MREPAEAAGSILYPRARAAVEAVGLICRVGDDPFATPQELMFGEFWFRLGRTRPTPRALQTAGILQFTLYPADGPDLPKAVVCANKLKDAFSEQAWTDGVTRVVTERLAVKVVRQNVFGRLPAVIADAGFDLFCLR